MREKQRQDARESGLASLKVIIYKMLQRFKILRFPKAQQSDFLELRRIFGIST